MKRLLAMLALTVSLCACGGGTGDGGPMGQDLFEEMVIGSNGGCITCHVVNEDRVLVGPSLKGIASRAGNVVPGLTAEQYIKQSITDPNSHVTEDFDPDVMPADWDISDAQVDSIVDYLMTLK